MSPLEITVLGVPIGIVIVGLGIAAFAAFSGTLYWLVCKVEVLTVRVTTNEYVTGELVARRVEEVTAQSCRDLNEVGRS